MKWTKGQLERVKSFFKTIRAPKGYTREVLLPKVNKEYHLCAFNCIPKLTIKGEDVEVQFSITCYKNSLGVIGTTNFKEGDSWYTFDRRGIEDSFYMYSKKDFNKWNDAEEKMWLGGQAMLKKQIKRAKERIEKIKGMLTVPHFGHRITEEMRDEIEKKLKAGGSHMFTPSGFGIAWEVSTRNSRWSSPVPVEVAKFFNVKKPLFKLDHDWD